MKKFLALLLALVMVLSMAACGNTPATDETQGTEAPEVAETYTYNTAMSVFPTIWNPHTYETDTSSDILGYISDGFYGFDYNDTMDGYKLVPFMTTDDHPVDITDQYVGKYGIAEGDTNKVYLINLRDDLAWEDGTPITAHDFVESAKRLLNPVAKNYRADTLYSGDVVIYNAEAYMKQGQTAPASVAAIMAAEGLADLDAFFAAHGEDIAFINWSYSFGAQYDFETTPWTEGTPDAAGFSLEAADEVVATPLTMNQMRDFFVTAAVAMNGADEATAISWIADELYIENTYPEVAWEDVGIFALSDTELVYAITSPMEGFYLKYGLPSSYLVHLETYDACESVVDGVYTNTYGTSVETTKSYGPYKLTSYQADKEFKFERNEYYFDLTDTTYQTTHIEIAYVPEITTREEMLIAGDLDVFGLDKDYMEVYSLSDYTYYAESASVWAMVFNPNKEALETTQAAAGENINKTMLTVPEFRQAMSLGMDRAKFSLATMPTCKPTFGLFSSQHITDPDAGTSYRTTEIAKEVLAKFWGVSEDYGEGKMYATLDEAVESITGYNPDLAKQKFDAAYDIAIEQGLMDEDDKIQICIGLPSATSTTYNNGYEFIVNHYTDLVVGTKLEGKITFTRDDTIGDNFAGSLQNNQVDMLFYVGWNGMELNPYGLMQAYVSPIYIYDASYDYSAIDLTIEIDGTEWTTSVYNWYEIMNGVTHEITDAEGNTKEFSCGTADNDPETRLLLLGSLEGAVLMNYNFIPLSGDASAQIKGQQIEYMTEDYIYGLGFGGVRYMQYNYSDAEWDAYVAENGGKLDYT